MYHLFQRLLCMNTINHIIMWNYFAFICKQSFFKHFFSTIFISSHQAKKAPPPSIGSPSPPLLFPPPTNLLPSFLLPFLPLLPSFSPSSLRSSSSRSSFPSSASSLHQLPLLLPYPLFLPSSLRHRILHQLISLYRPNPLLHHFLPPHFSCVPYFLTSLLFLVLFLSFPSLRSYLSSLSPPPSLALSHHQPPFPFTLSSHSLPPSPPIPSPPLSVPPSLPPTTTLPPPIHALILMYAYKKLIQTL